MRQIASLAVLLLSLVSLGSPTIAAPEASSESASAVPVGTGESFDYKVALKTSQAAIGTKIGDYRFMDTAGKVLSLKELRGKPLVVSLIYTSCYHICPMTTRHLAKVVKKARDALGDDSFSVAVIGFDTDTDTPGAMRYFGRQQGVNDDGWHLLSTDKATIDALTRELGFIYFPSPRGFDHLIQTTVIDAKGQVYRQIYGEIFETPLLVDPLKELILGRTKPGESLLSSVVNKVRLFCTAYDPARDAYVFDYSFFLGIAIGALIIISTILFIIRELLRGRQPPRT